jgi:hypothetical protein
MVFPANHKLFPPAEYRGRQAVWKNKTIIYGKSILRLLRGIRVQMINQDSNSRVFATADIWI